MSEFKPVAYRSFAEFFDREFRPGARPFTQDPHEMAAFAEARYFGWSRLDPEQRFPVKGTSLNAEQIPLSARDLSWVARFFSLAYRPWTTTMCITPTMDAPWAQ
jgi:phosphatidylserine decarboxylase